MHYFSMCGYKSGLGLSSKLEFAAFYLTVVWSCLYKFIAGAGRRAESSEIPPIGGLVQVSRDQASQLKEAINRERFEIFEFTARHFIQRFHSCYLLFLCYLLFVQ